MRLGFFSVAFLTVIACLGCGSGGPTTYSVTGKVTLDGQPLPNVNVAFFPSDRKLPSSGGVADSHGVYKLTTAGGIAGAVAGKHKVTVYGGGQAMAGLSATGQSNDPAVWKKKQEDAANSFKAVADTQTPKGRSAAPQNDSPVPEKYASPDKTTLEKDVGAKSNVIDLELSSK